MVNHELLRYEYNYAQAKRLQEKYRRIIQKDEQKSGYYIKSSEIKSIIGVDISYFKREQRDWGVACSVYWDFKERKIIDFHFAKSEIRFPYKPGFLGFRECPLLSKTIGKYTEEADVILCDGHGIIHPRKFGEAVHIGKALNFPSVGVAKNPFIGYYELDNFKKEKGFKTPIWAKDPNKISFSDNELLGFTVCLSDGKKPVFISPGYKIDKKTALKVVEESTFNHRQPEPLYLADKLSRKYISEEIDKNNHQI